MDARTRTPLASVLLLLAIAAAACDGDAGAAVEATAEDAGRTIALEPSQELVVTLDSNVTTGFRWVLATEPDARVLEVVGSTYVEPDSTMLGAGGQEVWTFRAVEEGRTTLGLRYERSSGEASGAPFELTIDVG
jgi:inhibitor of cysteine peptidase